MQFGICTPLDRAAEAKAAGWDFVEENVQKLLQGELPDDQWQGAASIAASPLPVIAANCLVPGSMKIVGPAADLAALTTYMQRVLTRAGATGVATLVFGSGGARTVPDDFPREQARDQIIAFLQMAAPIAQRAGVTLVVEPLNRKECNIINSVCEAMQYVTALNHPAVECLLDSYHFWLEDEKLCKVGAAVAHIRHVHVADKIGRTPPGESGSSDYLPLFRILKQAGYNGRISVEAANFTDIAGVSPRVLTRLRDDWEDA